MNVIVVVSIVGIITTTSTVAAPAPGTRCSPIIPVENCRNALTASGAENLTSTRILPVFIDIDAVLVNLLNRTATTNEQDGPYKLDNTGDRLCQPGTNASDRIARSVYTFKCEVPVVADIVKTESIRQLVLEQSNYATGFKKILKNMRVLFDLKELISRYQPINSCTVPEDSCPTFNTTGLDRLVVIKSIADDLFQLLADLKTAIQQASF